MAHFLGYLMFGIILTAFILAVLKLAELFAGWSDKP